MNSHIRILIVDTSPTHGLRTQMILEKNGYTVSIAQSASEGLNLLNNEMFDIIIADWNMKDMDFSEFCSVVKSRTFTESHYILVTSSDDSPKVISQAIKGGGDYFLRKPAETVELTAALNTARRIINLENELKQYKNKTDILSITDILTGVYNRRFLISKLPDEMKRAVRYQRPITIALCDIDNLSHINQEFGQKGGDTVLKETAGLINDTIRKDIDWAARYGDDKFIIVMPETDATGGSQVAERLKLLICEHKTHFEGQLISATSSFGIASFVPGQSPEGMSAEHLIESADKKLDQAKTTGGNCCES